MIDYGPFQFAAAPRTGASRFFDACFESGLKDDRGDIHSPFDSTHAKLKVSLTRHPCEWLLAAYRARGRLSILLPKGFGGFCELCDTSEEEFIRDYLETEPGLVGRLILSYKAESYLKYDTLSSGFLDLMRAIGHPFNLVRMPRPPVRATWTLSRDLFQQVLGAEREMAEHFDYW